jgi:thiol:disulfide interchange protein/DsbC/DsbD-like thiol-disulfide interchange protein
MIGKLNYLLRFLIVVTAYGSVGPLWAQMKDGQELVKASLISDVKSIQPGQKFRLGVLYRMAPGWHIYWKYSGDSGIPTKINWQLPPDFKAGDLQWPLPNRDKEPGDLEVFVYSGEVLLFAEVQAPAALPSGPLEMKAKSDWLVCSSSCIPGSAEMNLSIDGGASLPSESASIFQKYALTLPQPLPPTFKVGFNRSGKNLDLTVAGAPPKIPLDFYPAPPEDAVVLHVAANGNVLSIPIDTEAKPLSRLSGILVAGAGDDRHGYEIASDTSLSSGRPENAPLQAASFLTILQALGFAVVGGLILNVMPCVLPVISLKIFGFVREGGERPDKVFRLSMAFSAGILGCFALLAIVVILLRAAGAQVGWGFQFQDSRFVTLIACLVFAFALNLFGVFELSVSSRATGSISKLAAGEGYGGAFFQGVFATILATPCTAPFLGTASAFAFAQPSWVTLLVFFFVGFGMALPYLVLAVNPKWLKYLPKPGSWMIYLKQFMGFLLIGTLLWLIWVLGQMKGVNAIVSLGAMLLLIALMAWIKGSFWTPVSSNRSRLFALVALIAVVAVAGAAYGFVTKPSQLVWQPFNQETLDKAIASGRPVFVDFTADWCITCKSNERFAIDTPQVREEFAKRKVIMLKADWTNGDPAITAILKSHGRAGVPMYLVYPGGVNEPVLLPELISAQSVVNALNQDKT